MKMKLIQLKYKLFKILLINTNIKLSNKIKQFKKIRQKLKKLKISKNKIF